MKITRILLTTTLLACFSVMLTAQEYGVASYYSDKFQGKPTASGEPYDKDKYTAAHKTYAFGTILKVTRLDNKKSVKVRVIDRGPYVNGRIVDLSRKAAESLDLVEDGTARVKVEVVEQAPGASTTEPEPVVIRPPASGSTPAETQPAETQPRTQPTPPRNEPEPIQPAEETAATPAPREAQPRQSQPAREEESSAPEPYVTPVSSQLVTTENLEPFGLYHIRLEKPAQAGYAVQVGSMTNYNSVMRLIAELQGKWFKNILLSVEQGADGQPIYKVLLGPFDTQESANAYKSSVKDKTGIKGFVVNLADINY